MNAIRLVIESGSLYGVNYTSRANISYDPNTDTIFAHDDYRSERERLAEFCPFAVDLDDPPEDITYGLRRVYTYNLNKTPLSEENNTRMEKKGKKNRK